MLARHDEIVHGAVREAGGRVFKHTGDGMIAVFDDAEPAVKAAHASREARRAESWAVPQPLRVRTSIHSGPAAERDGDFFGPVVNRLARMNGAAHPDQLVVSNVVHQLLPDSVGSISASTNYATWASGFGSGSLTTGATHRCGACAQI